MYRKTFLLIISGFLTLFSLGAQDTISYEFINSIYKNHIRADLDYYFLNHKPSGTYFSDELKDTLSNYLSAEDILFIQKQLESPDTSFSWDQDRLINCRVINDYRREEILSKIRISSAQMIDLRTGLPVKMKEKEPVPDEEQQIYYFATPVWNSDRTLIVFHTIMEEGNHGAPRTYIYKRIEGNWVIVTNLRKLDWNSQ